MLTISAELRAEAEALDATPTRFRDFIEQVNPRYVFYRHCEVLIEHLQAIADQELGRLMIFMPPRSGKSETVSRLFPAYYVMRHPDQFVGLNSYGSALAYTLSRNARNYYSRFGGELAGDAAAVQQWETPKGGGLWAAGVGGAITGKGFHLGIIDDPIRNAEDAQSEIVLDKQWDWYQSTYYTRREPGAALIHTQTRWNMGDLAGRLLEFESEGDEPEHWHIINFEAIKSSRQTVFPATCTVEEDPRKAGEALNPDRQDLAELEAIRKKVGSYWFAALYQQSPAAEEGNLWKRVYFRVYDELPKDKETGELLVYDGGYDWDTAYTKEESNAANAYVYSFRDEAGGVYIHDFDFQWMETPELVRWMKQLGGPHYIEKKASGKSAKDLLDREGIYAVPVKVEGGDKIARTRSCLPVGEAGKLYVRRAIMDRLLDDDKQGILAFPNSKWKDVNDALTQAINRHVGSPVSGVSSTWIF